MIDPHELAVSCRSRVRRLFIPVEDQELQVCLSETIDLVVQAVLKRVRIGRPLGYAPDLFTLKRDSGIVHRQGHSYIADPYRVQEIAFGVMRQYGFDEKASEPRDGSWVPGYWAVEGVRFPSQSIPGLAFYRLTQYQTDAGKTLKVCWRVEDRAPKFRVSLKRPPITPKLARL